jgi:hypothetical protein
MNHPKYLWSLWTLVPKLKKRKKNGNNSIKNGLQNKVDIAKNAEIKNNKFKENAEEKESKEDKDKESNIKYCPMKATLEDLLMKPSMKANISKIRKKIKCIVGQQECVGAKQTHNNIVLPDQSEFKIKIGLCVP